MFLWPLKPTKNCLQKLIVLYTLVLLKLVAFRAGTVKSSIEIGNLLLSGIGDTIRVSLSSDPCDEVKVDLIFWILLV